jgi:hypothetical protein
MTLKIVNRIYLGIIDRKIHSDAKRLYYLMIDRVYLGIFHLMIDWSLDVMIDWSLDVMIDWSLDVMIDWSLDVMMNSISED